MLFPASGREMWLKPKGGGNEVSSAERRSPDVFFPRTEKETAMTTTRSRPVTDLEDLTRRAYIPTTETRNQDAHAVDHPDLDPDHHLWKNGTRWWIAITAVTTCRTCSSAMAAAWSPPAAASRP